MSSERILVVDDDAQLLDVIAALLTEIDLSVTTADNAIRALGLIQTRAQGDEPFDLLVTDLRMPGMDGLELVSSLRDLHINLPVVAVSAYGDEAARERMFALGCLDFIDKPFKPDDLKKRIRAGLAATKIPVAPKLALEPRTQPARTSPAQAGEVYLQRTETHVGVFDTVHEATLESYWLALPQDGGMTLMILLDMNGEQTPIRELVDPEEFVSRFLHQPGYLASLPSPKERLINRVIQMADDHYQQQEYNSAEYEYKRAIKLDEESVRANFGLGMTYLVQHDFDQAREVFSRLAKIEAVYEPRHKHLFNEFGIGLRKSGLYEQALEHYYRALTISTDDEHLWFNLGRALFEDKQKAAAVAMIQRALKINPQFYEAKAYLKRYIYGDQSPSGGLEIDRG